MASYTGLSLGTPSPAPELVDRGEWASVNLDSLSQAARPGRRAARGAPRVRGPARRRPQGRRCGDRRGRGGARDRLHLAARARPVRAVAARAATRRRGCCSSRRTCARRCTSWTSTAVDFHRWIVRPRADPRLPVPGRRLAARPPRRADPRATCRPSRCRSSAAPPAGCRRCRTPAKLVETLPRRRAGRAGPDQGAARPDRAAAGGDGGHRGLLRARDGRARRRRRSPATRSCARRWTRAATAARRRSACSQRLLGLDMKMRQYEQGKALLRRGGGRGRDRRR